MSSIRVVFRCLQPSITFVRPLSTSVLRMAGPGKAQAHKTNPEHRKYQTEKPLNPHMTNTTSTIANSMPSVGAQKAPPELISSVDGDFVPKDSVPENTERMTGGSQNRNPKKGMSSELGVGEMEGGEFKIEPLRRSGEDQNTMRARLVYQSRKRGTLESDLLMSTFADRYLQDMTMEQMIQYDLFLDENDWDIYYWATQEPTPTSQETAEGAELGGEGATANAQGKELSPAARSINSGKQTRQESATDHWRQGEPRSGEWAQTVGTFKPAYRPVPARWKNSEILAMLRRHVKERSAGGIHEGQAEVGGEGLGQSVRGTGGGGMAFMPDVRNMDR